LLLDHFVVVNDSWVVSEDFQDLLFVDDLMVSVNLYKKINFNKTLWSLG
jgi:hypothetical protein